MKTIAHLIPKTIAAGFCVLFTYAAVSKGLDFENFQVQLAQSPLLSAYAGQVSYGVIALELLITAMLLIPKTQKTGLYAAFALMVAFTAYIYLILNYSDFVPCSCGGILEKMGWTQHLIFNSICVMLAGTAVVLRQKNNMPMVRKSILHTTAWLAILTLLSSGIIIALFFSSEYIIKKENNFTRRFLMHPIIEGQSITLDNDFYYFAGNTETHIYLANKKYPEKLKFVDTTFLHTDSIKMKIERANYRSIQVKVQYPYYYFFDGTIPAIYRGKLNENKVKIISHKDAYFNQIIPLDSVNFIIKTQSRKTKQASLATLSVKNNPKVTLYPHILEKQVDGVFDCDGKLVFDQYNRKGLYLYLYRNQYIVFDPGTMQIEYKLNTIDTTRVANIKVIRSPEGSYQFKQPPLAVNHNIAVNKNLVFIQSGLRGRYESSASWSKAKVIDIYRVDKQQYVGSFYIYNKGKNRLSDFMATDNYFYTIIGRELRRYNYRYPIK